MLDPRRIIAKRDLTEIERLTRELEPRLARTIMAALREQADTLNLDAIVEALRAGRPDRVMAMISADKLEAAMAPVRTVLRQTLWSAGVRAATRLIQPVLRGAAFRFNELNPRLIDWLQNYELNLIKEINDRTREGVRAALTTGVTEGKGPIDTARDVREVVGLTDRQTQAVLNFRRNLETFHERRSAVAWGLGNKIDRLHGSQVFKPDDDGTPMDEIDERRLRDFRYDQMLMRAMANSKPLTPAQIDKMVAAYRRKYLKHRAEVIARTETLRTNNAGIQDAWRQAVEAGKVSEELIRRKWIVAADERLCVFCAPIPDLNPKLGVRLQQPFATPKGPIMLPPLHPNCRCTVTIRAYEPQQIERAA